MIDAAWAAARAAAGAAADAAWAAADAVREAQAARLREVCAEMKGEIND